MCAFQDTTIVHLFWQNHTKRTKNGAAAHVGAPPRHERIHMPQLAFHTAKYDPLCEDALSQEKENNRRQNHQQ